MSGTLFRHREYRQFKLGRFIFKNHLLELTNDRDVEEFMALAKQLPPREYNNIRVVNRAAIANMESGLPPMTARGAMGTNDFSHARENPGIVGDNTPTRAEQLKAELDEKIRQAEEKAKSLEANESSEKDETAENKSEAEQSKDTSPVTTQVPKVGNFLKTQK